MPVPGGSADLVAAVVHGGRAALLGADVRVVGSLEDVARELSGVETASRPRWVWWSARYAGELASAAATPIARAWDLAEAHRILHGGWNAEPGRVWAAAHGIPLSTMPTPSAGDLFDFSAADEVAPDELVRPDGHLRADAASGWLEGDDRLIRWAEAALDCAVRQRERAQSLGARTVGTIHSESAAALLCLELERGGLPVDRPVLERLIGEFAGPRAASEEAAAAARRERDAEVLRHVPGRESTDLRNPQQVRDMLAGVGVDVPNTRKWVLDAYRQVHPVVEALLAWRKAERIATTYGYRWLDECVGPDDRLRGGWSACDGAAGRMTAENGLHNLPAALRSGVAAHPGHVFVRADLGQIEPRVLAVVSGDPAFAEATRADDLYAPVAARLGVERPVAKVAVLAAMYGQRSGAAGEALRGLERAYPVAMGLLDRAYESGVRGEPLRTFGGRLIPTGRFLAQSPVGANPALDAARGRFARNAIIQGAAAELFKAWAATVRALGGPLGAQIVLCLHDELIVHAPAERADEVAALVDRALADASRRWAAGAPVRFVADTSVIARWSDAKD
ncbi:DNA polymerase [Knoellia locipacati]|uniref:DNA polymerase n=1 Tax=Knoellia locipacati TaxID=882824 RepID=UPI00384A6A91